MGDNAPTGRKIKPLSGDDPGRLGAYRLLGRIASGGMGRIYLARPAADGPLVAVKTLLDEGVVSEIDRRRFAREVTLARRINSAYTARVLDADPDAERPWMAIEYIAAPALSELVGTAGRLPGSAVRWIAAGTARALVTLHEAGIVHRDVKPQNILLPQDGPRLIDFGISHASDITRTTLTLGTIAFTSPEQARAEPSGPASDVYSLGATLFHTAVGRPPYADTGDTIRLLTLVQRGELDLTGLPKELAPLIRPCLATDPAVRPAPGDVLQGFLDDLDRFATSRRGDRWLPPRWTALIKEYEAQGRALRTASAATAGGVTSANQPRSRPAGSVDPEALTIDQRTRQVPPPTPTRAYTDLWSGGPGDGQQVSADRAEEIRREQQERARVEWEREARESRERQAREARRRREEELRGSAGSGTPGGAPGAAGPASGTREDATQRMADALKAAHDQREREERTRAGQGRAPKADRKRPAASPDDGTRPSDSRSGEKNGSAPKGKKSAEASAEKTSDTSGKKPSGASGKPKGTAGSGNTAAGKPSGTRAKSAGAKGAGAKGAGAKGAGAKGSASKGAGSQRPTAKPASSSTGPGSGSRSSSGSRSGSGPRSGSGFGSGSGSGSPSGSGSGAGSSSGAGSGSGSGSGSSSSESGCFWVAVVVIVVALLIWQPWNHDSSGSGSSGSSGSSGGYSSSGSSGLSDDTSTSGGTDSLTAGDTSGSSSGLDDDTGSGTDSGADSEDGASETSSPPPDPVDTAFASVDTADCLDAYQNGYGQWSRTSPQPVSCGSADAYLRVTRTGGGATVCPTGGGRGSWEHTNTDYSSTTLCLERQFRTGQCFLAKANGDQPGGADLLTLWNCSADKVPQGFNYIMQVTAIMASSAGTGACPGDGRHYTYSWNVYDGGTMLCAKVA